MSERTVDSNLKTGAESSRFNYVVLVSLDFEGGFVRVHNSIGTLSFGGNDYLGVGAFGTISFLSESIEMVDQPVTLTLSSITTEIIDELKTSKIYGRDAEIFIGSLDDDGRLQGTPDSWIVGHMEHASLIAGSENAVSIKIQTRAARLQSRNNRRWTIEHHQKEFPGDLFFQWLPYVINAEVIWGGERVRSGYTNEGSLAGSGAGEYEDFQRDLVRRVLNAFG